MGRFRKAILTNFQEDSSMKKLLFLTLLVVFVGGCAKRTIVYVPVSLGASKAEVEAAEKVAVQEAKRVEDNARMVEKQTRWKAQAGLSCPFGGYDEVVIHPALGNEFKHWNGGGVAGFLIRRYVMVHRAKNPYTNMTLDITNGGEPAVSRMCPGGSITLVQSMPPFNGGYYLRVIWTAEGIVGEKLAYGDSSPGTLYQGWYNMEAVAKRPTWIMNLERVDRT
ncbi:MAG: hypothetical protein ABH856_00665, partial [Patescibacteria group bacterium]